VAFHTIVAKALYVTKQARPDTNLAIAFLTTRVRAPDTDDWKKYAISWNIYKEIVINL
jgi:hypothetical protein